MKTMYITIAGMNHYYGSEIFEKGMQSETRKRARQSGKRSRGNRSKNKRPRKNRICGKQPIYCSGREYECRSSL